MTVQEWLGEDNKLGIDIWERKYRYKDETFDEWLDRVSAGDFELRNLIKEKKFLFGGRTLANRGLGDGNYFNCFSAGYVEDDYNDIMDVASKIGLTFKAQGGQGLSLSKLRPKGAPIGDRYQSDGIIPFLQLYDTVTGITSQAGSRKGALLVSLDIRHKEAEEFIKIKTQPDTITKANLSLEIDDEFMQAVETYYKTGEVITLHEKRTYSGHVVEYDVVPIKLYKLMMQCAYDWGEPGCIFTEKFRNYNMLQYDDEYNVETCNPCGEQPLKKDSNCNLGSINLAEFVKNEYTSDAYIDYEELIEAIRVAVRALDGVIDENIPNLPLEVHKQNARDWRNIGLGLMGVGTALFKLGLRYGEPEAVKFIDDLFRFVFKKAVEADILLAETLGAYPKYDPILWESDIMRENGYDNSIFSCERPMRNCSLLSIAPTGSISTMLGVTGGCEPEFSIHYTRKTDNLDDSYEVYCAEARHYMQKFGTDKLPPQFVCSADVPWKERIDMQAAMQKHVDTAISSTVNLPYETTVEEIEQLYLYAWQKGLKGITIFRDGCKRAGILTVHDDKSEEETKTELRRGDVVETSDGLIGLKRRLVTGCGTLHCTAFFDPVTGDLMETYLSKGSTGGCLNSLTGLSRMISLAARGGLSISQIVDQLDSCGVCPSYAVRTAKQHDTSKGSCCPIAIGKALEDMHNQIMKNVVEFEVEQAEEATAEEENARSRDLHTTKDLCPECGEPLVLEGGCNLCKNCGWSKCN